MGDSCWFDRKSILFPYSSSKSVAPPIRVASASGCYLTLEDGRRLLDGISSWWSVCHGYSHPHIIRKMKEKVELLSHVMFCCDLVHEEAFKLSSRLIDIAPVGLEKVFFADSGSMAVEVAMKIAIQYWYSQGKTKKQRFIHFRNSYHGDSMGCMSVSDPYAIHGKAFLDYYPTQYLFDIPRSEAEAELLEESIVSKIRDEVAALIIEPILQGAGGMLFHSSEQLMFLKKIAERNNILFIADEVATGFGRIGTMFACEQASITPDIMVLGKAITGGACPLSATLVSSDICQQFSCTNSSPIHGNTFMANPVSCAAANASLDIFEGISITEEVSKIESILQLELEELKFSKNVHNVRIKGAVAAMNVTADFMECFYGGLREKLMDLGIWLRPIRDVVYLMPPLVIQEEELLELTRSLKVLFQNARQA